MRASRRRMLSLENIAKITFAFMLLLALFSVLYSVLIYKDNPPTLFLQYVQTIAIIVQAVILFIQTGILSRQLDLYRYHEIPIIVLKRSEGDFSRVGGEAINVKNLTDNPAFYIKLEEINAKSCKKIDDEIAKNIGYSCNIVEYLGPREEREMCYIANPYKFAEVVDIVKISYWDAYGDWHEIVFRVDRKDKIVFTPVPQNIFKQKT